MFIILKLSKANNNILKTVLVHVCHWPCSYGRDRRYPDISFKHRGTNGAAAVPPVQRTNDDTNHYL
jgi:hypothetical protein